MNLIEKKIRKFISLHKENKLQEYTNEFDLKELKKIQKLFIKIISLKTKPTEGLKSLCRGSSEKRIKDILKKEYLTEGERVSLAVWAVANNRI